MGNLQIEKIKKDIQESIELKEKIANPAFLSRVKKAADVIVKALKNGSRVFLCGNGGSAADCQHWAGEMTGRFLKEREPLGFISLAANTSVITSIGNDYSFDEVFARQIEGAGKKGDILICISTSGKSKNIIAAAGAAQKKGLKVLSLTGRSPNLLSKLADMQIAVPSDKTPRIQEVHIFIIHAMCKIVEESLFPRR